MLDLPLGDEASLVIGIAKSDRGDCDRRAIRIHACQHVENWPKLRRAQDSIDLRLSDLSEVAYSKRSQNDRRWGNHCFRGRQQRSNVRIGRDVIDQMSHLRETVGCERFSTEDERDKADVPYLLEKVVNLANGVGDSAVLRQYRDVRAFENGSAPAGAGGQHDGDDQEYAKGDPGSGRNEVAEAFKYLIHIA